MRTLTTLACVAFATLSFAQSTAPMKPDELAKHQTEMLTSTMKLDDEQSAKLSAMMTEAAVNTEELRQQCREIDMKINAQYDEQMAAFVAGLSQEQQNLYAAARKEGKIDFATCGVGACAPGAGKAAGGCSSGKSTGSEKSLNSGKSCCASGASHGEAKPAGDEKATPAKK